MTSESFEKRIFANPTLMHAKAICLLCVTLVCVGCQTLRPPPLAGYEEHPQCQQHSEAEPYLEVLGFLL